MNGVSWVSCYLYLASYLMKIAVQEITVKLTKP